ncbi:MAG: TusE/DsrC/DsvC family sulfur relay protein [Myxococcales bacterium]|nr:TusE/DsrC/DsvC family sulfur relay protein [Myxococcales bacterium]
MMDAATQEKLTKLEAKLDVLTSQMAYLVERQKKTEELFAEATPILREVMNVATHKLDDLDKRGYFLFGSELLSVGERIVEGFTPDDVRQLGDAVVSILETVRAMTQPEVLQIAGEASAAFQSVDKVEPMGILGMVRATRDDEVQRGMAVMMDLMRHVGKAAEVMASKKKPSAAESKRQKLDAITGARKKKALGVERPAPRPQSPASAPRARAHTVAATPPPTTRLGGVEFTPDGHLADASAWTPELANDLAAALGVALGEEHLKVIAFAREDFEKTGVSPNIRRITLGLGVTTKDLYALFPKAPGRTIAKIAGIPKPAGCL